MAESSRKMQELRAQIQVYLQLSKMITIVDIGFIIPLIFPVFIYNLVPTIGSAETSRPPEKDG